MIKCIKMKGNEKIWQCFYLRKYYNTIGIKSFLGIKFQEIS